MAVSYEFGCTLEKSRSRLKNAGVHLRAAIESQVSVGSTARAYIKASRNYRRLVKKFVARQVSVAAPSKKRGKQGRGVTKERGKTAR